MPTFYFVRHGEKQPGVSNPELTERGHGQARATGKYLRQFPITRIIASPAQRTQQTAEHIAHELSLPFTTDKRLVERLEWDLVETSREGFIAEWIKTTQDRDYQPRWGDSARATGDRVTAVAHSTHDESEHIVLVSHGGTIVDFLRNHFEDQKLSSLVKIFPEGDDYIIEECAVTIVSSKENQLRLVSLHLTDHLK